MESNSSQEFLIGEDFINIGKVFTQLNN